MAGDFSGVEYPGRLPIGFFLAGLGRLRRLGGNPTIGRVLNQEWNDVKPRNVSRLDIKISGAFTGE